MALKRPKGPPGTLVVLEHTSKILKDNPRGDARVRKVAVWLPARCGQRPAIVASGDPTTNLRDL